VNWRCEPRIKPLLEVLLKHKRVITGSDNFRPPNVSEWVSGARETAAWLDAFSVPESKWEEWMRWALRKHNQNMLAAGGDPSVKSTRTLQYTVEQFSKKMPKFENFFGDVEDGFEEDYGTVCAKCEKVVVNYNDDGVCADCQMVTR
jgi:hypothetical protein